MSIKLSDVEGAFKRTLATGATPHREPDFKKLRERSGEANPDVRGVLAFVEENNTGYDGILERWMMTIDYEQDKGGLAFFVDLIPGQFSTDVVLG